MPRIRITPQLLHETRNMGFNGEMGRYMRLCGTELPPLAEALLEIELRTNPELYRDESEGRKNPEGRRGRKSAPKVDPRDEF